MTLSVEFRTLYTMKNWGLVLSGGIAYSMANAGVLEVLEEEGLRPNCVAGSSMGAIIGGMYALGISPKKMRRIAQEMKIYEIAEPSYHLLKNGIYSGILTQKLEKHILPLVGDATINDCIIPFTCIAGRVIKPIQWHKILTQGFTDHALDCVEKYVFPRETKLIDAMLASSAIPVVFTPATIGKNQFIDLCHFGAIPARTLREIHNPEIIFSTITRPNIGTLSNMLPSSWTDFITSGLQVMNDSIASCDLTVTPEMIALPFRFDKAEEFMNAGYKAMKMTLPDLIVTIDA